MKFYRYLYGTDSMDSYREIQRSRHLDGFLFDQNITEQSEMVIRNAREYFSGFSIMPGYERYPKTERPVAIRYAPLYYDGLLRRSNVKPIYAFGVSAEENRGSEGKWADLSTNRQTFFTQIDFFSAEKVMEDDEYTHLDVLFGIRPMTDEDVRKVRHGEARLDSFCTVNPMQPVLDPVDRNHILAAAAALYQGKCVAFVLEEGVPFNRRARELLLNVYSLLQPMDAYRTGYSIYQNPKTISNVINQWSVKIFVVPGDRDPENGTDPAQEIPRNVVVVDMRKPCAIENTKLWNTLGKWMDFSWKMRKQAMASALKGDNMLLARSDESENIFWQNEFLSRSDTFFQGVEELANWVRNADLSQLETLADIQRAYVENIQPWSSVPGSDEIFRNVLDQEAKKRREMKERGMSVTPLDISRMTADAYADLMLNKDTTRDQALEDLYQFGKGMTFPDPRTAWKRCESYQLSIRQEMVEAEVSKLKVEYTTRISELEIKEAEYSRVKEALQVGDDADDVRINEKISSDRLALENTINDLKHSNSELTKNNERLNDHIASLYPGQPSGEDHAARINELLVAEEIISKCSQQLGMIGSSNQEIAARVGKLLDSEQKLCRCIEKLELSADAGPTPEDRIQELLEAEKRLDKCLEALGDMQGPDYDPAGDINRLKTRVTELKKSNNDLTTQNKNLQDEKTNCIDLLRPLNIDLEKEPDIRIAQLVEAEKTYRSCCEKLNVSPYGSAKPGGVLENKIGRLINHDKDLEDCAKVLGLERKDREQAKKLIEDICLDQKKCEELLENCGYTETKLFDRISAMSEDRDALDELIGQVDTWAENGDIPTAEWRKTMQHTIPEKDQVDTDRSLRARLSRFFVDMKRSWSTRKSHLILSFVSGALAVLMIVGSVNLLSYCFKSGSDIPQSHQTETISPSTVPTTVPPTETVPEPSTETVPEPSTEPPTHPTTEPITDTTQNDPSSWITPDMLDILKNNCSINTIVLDELESLLGETYGQVPLALFSDKEVTNGEALPACYVLAMTNEPQNTEGLYAYLTYNDICIAVKHSDCTDHSLLLAIRLMTQIVEIEEGDPDQIRVYVRLDKNGEDEPLVEIQEPIKSRPEATTKWLWDITSCYSGKDAAKYSETTDMKYPPLLILESENWYVAYSDSDKINSDAEEMHKLFDQYDVYICKDFCSCSGVKTTE